MDQLTLIQKFWNDVKLAEKFTFHIKRNGNGNTNMEIWKCFLSFNVFSYTRNHFGNKLFNLKLLWNYNWSYWTGEGCTEKIIQEKFIILDGFHCKMLT